MTVNSKQLTGVVLLNLGGPDSLNAVRPFLFNLFSDRDIIRLGPPFLQKPIAWLISTLRSNKTKGMYHKIGGKSPILDITSDQAAALEKALNERTRLSLSPLSSFKVYIGMRYWHPFIKETLQKIVHDGVNDLIVLSLYPHYSKATTGSSINQFKREVSQLKSQNLKIKIEYIDRWYDFPAYIESLSDIVFKGINDYQGEDFDILYSAHSLPESFIREGDPYLDHIKATINSVNRRLSEHPYNIKGLKWHLSFQSKTGPVKWLDPTTEETIENLAHSGCRNLLVVPISFVSDHIETLFEIDILYRELAEKHGMILKRCTALNTSDKFIHAMKELVLSKTSVT